MRWNEINNVYYHLSLTKLKLGTILVPSHSKDKWIDIVQFLEKYRPSNMLSHDMAVFMCDDYDFYYEYDDWLYEVNPLGIIQKHNMGWYSEIDWNDVNSKENRIVAENYWSGKDYIDGTWEYMTPKAKIIKCVRAKSNP